MNSLEIPGIARLAPGQGGLPRYEITTPGGEAHIYLYGAHVTHFAPTGQKELIFLSKESHFEPGKAIRGGVPVIFPWFGLRENAPQHGFVRTQNWTPELLTQLPDGSVTLTLRLDSNAETLAIWGEPHTWTLRHRITVGATLTLELEIENRGTAPFRCEEALHTYFQIGDVRQTQVSGLEGAEYYDKIDSMRRKRQGSDPIRFGADETTQFYTNNTQTCVIIDPVEQRRIFVAKTNSASTMVWTPMSVTAQKIPDMGDNEWPNMVCVETGNVIDDTLTLAPGQRHSTRTILRCEKL